MPPFDKIKDEDFAPAYTAALAEHLKEVDAIANRRTRRRSKTRWSGWSAGAGARRGWIICSDLAGANTNPDPEVESEMAPKLSAHTMRSF